MIIKKLKKECMKTCWGRGSMNDLIDYAERQLDFISDKKRLKEYLKGSYEGYEDWLYNELVIALKNIVELKGD